MTEDMKETVRRGRAAASAAFFAQGFGFAVVLTRLATFKTRWDLDDLDITVIMFLVALLAGVGSVVAGMLAGRRGSGTALRIGLVGLAVALLVAAFAPVFVVFCIGIAVYGVALGCVDATTNMQAVACEAAQGRSILTSFHGAWSAGGILGALVTSGTSALGWSLTAALAPVAVIPALAAAAPFLPGTATEPGDLPRDRPPLVIPWRPLAMLGLAIVLFYVADSATSSWSTIYLRDVLFATAGVAPLGYAAYQATSLVSRLAGDHLVRRVGPVLVVRCAAVVAIVGLVAVILAQSPWLAVLGFAVLGAGIAVVAPLTFSAAGRLAAETVGPDASVDDRRTATDAIIARLNQFNYLGFILGGVLTGLVASGSSMRAGFVVPLVGIVLILPLARTFARGRGRAAAVPTDAQEHT